MNKEDYKEQKKTVLTGQITEKFTPYMFEYYKHMCKEKGLPILITDVEHFNFSLDLFLKLPVTTGDNMNEFMLNQRPQTISSGVKKVLQYFDKQYGIS